MTLNELCQIASVCTSCSLNQDRIKPVFSKGSHSASIMICGMVPAKDENLVGTPFVGRAGKLLDILLEQANLDYEQVYITNLVKCPVKPGTSLEDNWINSCSYYLNEEINIIKPKLIISLGKDASFNLLGLTKGAISGIIGGVYEYNWLNIMPTYHPSFLVRKGGTKAPEYLQVAEHFKQAKLFCDNYK